MARPSCYDSLVKRIASFESVLVAFSGGADSLLVLAAAKEALGFGAIGVTAASPLLPSGELEAAMKMAATLGVKPLIVEIDPLGDEDFLESGKKRCYFCKRLILSKMMETASKVGASTLIDGTNSDDLLDDRPGLLALKEFGVLSPLAELNMGKSEVRMILKTMGSPFWNKPPQSCLATRIGDGQRITSELLGRIDRAEAAVKGLGISHVRVRSLGPKSAKIELDFGGLTKLAERMIQANLLADFSSFGFDRLFICEKGGEALALPQLKEAHGG
ncbi:MAG: ATP-dependent sacrificial sulfur transferase LarE [Actinomycetota bacterium]|nr:ATP-dependent sacrificial sulfur transferase LarE [Actinomycetota bacterium]